MHTLGGRFLDHEPKRIIHQTLVKRYVRVELFRLTSEVLVGLILPQIGLVDFVMVSDPCQLQLRSRVGFLQSGSYLDFDGGLELGKKLLVLLRLDLDIQGQL